MVERASLRIYNKKKALFNCGKCRSSVTRVYKQLGTIPEVSEELSQAFWKKANETATKELGSVAEQYTLKHSEKDETLTSVGGDWLPLSVWERRGFDTALIEANSAPQNVRSHPVLGMTYRVAIQGSSSTEVKASEKSRTDTASSAVPPTVPTTAPAPTSVDELQQALKQRKVQEAKKSSEAAASAKRCKAWMQSIEELRKHCGPQEAMPAHIGQAVEALIAKAMARMSCEYEAEACPHPGRYHPCENMLSPIQIKPLHLLSISTI